MHVSPAGVILALGGPGRERWFAGFGSADRPSTRHLCPRGLDATGIVRRPDAHDRKVRRGIQLRRGDGGPARAEPVMEGVSPSDPRVDLPGRGAAHRTPSDPQSTADDLSHRRLRRWRCCRRPVNSWGIGHAVAEEAGDPGRRACFALQPGPLITERRVGEHAGAGTPLLLEHPQL